MRTLMVLALLPACAVDSLTTSTQEVEERPAKRYEKLLCDPNFCVLHDEDDSDGDGIADVDELVLETDPRDPRSHPEVADLAALVPAHALPSFELGSSMLVLLPTIDANGLPVFGGEASLPTRRSALERAGISVPSGIDVGSGFSMTRTLADTELTFHGLFSAATNGRDARLASGIGGALGSFGDHLSDVEHVYKETSGDTEFGQVNAFDDRRGSVTVTYENGPNAYFHADTRSEAGDYHSETRHTTDKFGEYTHTTTDQHSERTGEAGTTTTDVHTVTDTATSADGHTKFSTTTTTVTTTDASGQTTTNTTTTTKSCTDNDCETTTTTSTGSSNEGEEAGEAADGAAQTAYRNPEHDEVGVSPQTLHMVLVMLGSNVNVSSDSNGPVINYGYTPVDVGNKWGPVALYGGDEGYVPAPTFLHVPSATPDYDPELQHGLPPPELPADDSCLYCYQP